MNSHETIGASIENPNLDAEERLAKFKSSIGSRLRLLEEIDL